MNTLPSIPAPPKAPRNRYLGPGLLLAVLAGLGAFFLDMYLGLREAFFSPPVVLSGEQFDAARLAHVAADTGIVFPLGTVGLEYHYRHGQDPYGFAKLSIPADKVDFLLAHAKIVHMPGFVPASDPGLSWWQPQSLVNMRELSGKHDESTAAKCVVGEESGRTIVYVAWFL